MLVGAVSTSPRFYAPDANAEGDTVALPAEEAEHCTRVLRLKAGAPLRVFNGRGHEFDAVIVTTTKTDVVLAIGRTQDPTAREARVALTLVQAALKGDKVDEVVRDATMIGVAAIQPVITARSEVTLAALRRGHRHERWRRIAVAAAKQSGRATVPVIFEPCAWDEVTSGLAALKLPLPGIIFVEPAAAVEGTQSLHDLRDVRPREATVIVGPEGGWTSEELAQAFVTCRFVTLGGRTIRADAMPLVAVAALYSVWGEW